MIKFIHCADIHINRPFLRLKANESLRQKLIESSYSILDNIILLAISKKVNLVIIAGDLLDTLEHTVKAELRCRKAFEKLNEHDIPVYIIGGNHDPIKEEKVYPYPENVHVFSKNVESIPITGFKDAYIHGISYPTESVPKNLVKEFPMAKGDIDIGVLHCEVGRKLSGDYSPCTKDDLLSKNYQYWALGHIHKPTELSDFPAIVYSGSPMGKTPNETGKRGCYYVEVTSSRVKKEFIPLADVIWLQQKIDIQGLDYRGLMLSVKETLENLKREYNEKGVIVRVILTGRGYLHNIDKDDLKGITEELRSKVDCSHDFVWLESIQKETLHDVNLQSLKQQQSFLGDFLNYCSEVEKDSKLQREILDELSRGNAKLVNFLDKQQIDMDVVFKQGLQKAVDLVVEKVDYYEDN
ncbi:metallophosphoesterase [Proteinivorax hydrogeniformans]|uniref:Metallophosphoesterase n=1 Tax=Proteinivorax hydrogeniformans TaxID=1826727 RepID=A0AAU8HTV1_9FIRM